MNTWIRARLARPGDDATVLLERWVIFWTQLAALAICVILAGVYRALGVPIWAHLACVAMFTASIFLLLSKFDTAIAFTIGCVTALLGSLAIQWVAGGFVASGGSAMWAIAAVAAASIYSRWMTRVSLIALFILVPLELAAEVAFVPVVVPRPAWVAPLFAVFNVTGLAALVGAFLAYTAQQRKLAADALAQEHRRSESLLLNVLPAPIAERLKSGPGIIADRFEEATILFADVVGFTELSARMKPEELVGLLDRLFSEFDDLAGRFGLEKIKTIGDAYMVAGGIPTPHPDAAGNTAQMALAMIDASRRVAPDLGLRIGMHLGPVVAGVIGKKKFTYDLWGDAVNTASRMESHGEAGQVHVTAAVRARLGEAFAFTARGTIPIKGLGQMETYFLLPGPR